MIIDNLKINKINLKFKMNISVYSKKTSLKTTALE